MREWDIVLCAIIIEGPNQIFWNVFRCAQIKMLR
jgi:hypothetical protein